MIEKVLRSEMFLRRLRKAAAITAKKGLESGFRVIAYQDRLHFGKPIEGRCAYMASWDFNPYKHDLPKKIQKALFWGEAEEVINLHFHPPSFGVICPSAGDLFSLVEDEEGNCLISSIGIGQVDEEGNIRLLVIFKGKSDILSIRIIQEEIDDRIFLSQEEANEFLEKAGFKVKVFFFPVSGKVQVEQ